MEKTAFRCDAFNGAPYYKRMNPVDVIQEEILELGNTDILDTVNSLYCGGEDLVIKGLLDAIENGDFNDEGVVISPEDWNIYEAPDIADYIQDVIKKKTGKSANYWLWLASKEAVEDLYANDSDEDTPILEFDITNAVVISDLGYDGVLYGFAKEPEPLD